MIPNRNVLWAQVAVQELVRSGVRHVCLSPGSRSAPLAFALAAQPTLRVTTHLDERSGAYFALGIAKATGEPVAVLATSGTAVANFLPAIVEASYARIPLVVLTADRPPELKDVGANQSIEQAGIYGRFVRFAADVGLPEPRADRVRHLRALVGRAVGLARGVPAGPVHLNFPFREPLDPRVVPGDVPEDWAAGDALAEHGREQERPYVDALDARMAPEPESLERVANRIRSQPRGLIVCGPQTAPEEFLPAVTALARRTGWPILADPLSGVRFGAPADVLVISGYDAFLADPRVRRSLPPSMVLRFGAAPTSKSLLSFLREAAEAEHVVVDESGRLWDETSNAALILRNDAADASQTLAAQLAQGPPPKPDSKWVTRWANLESNTWNFLGPDLEQRPFEGALVARLVHQMPPGSTLFVSNSLPIRDLDRFARTQSKPLHVLANRGASGIDGILSSALGAAYGLQQKVTVLIGDLAFLDDLSALVAAKRLPVSLDIILVNNDGGGIFELLPVATHDPPFTDLFATPHGLDAAALARAFGFSYQRLPLSEALRVRLTTDQAGPRILEIESDRKTNAHHRRELEAQLAQALVSPEALRAD